MAGAVGPPHTYWIVAAAYVALAAAALVAPLPPHEPGESHPGAAHETALAGGAPGGRLALLRTPAIAVAVAICTICFFGDGAIEGYAALFLREALESGTLLTGAALAAFHGASLVGRLVFARPSDERLVLTIAGLLASAAMALVVIARDPAVAAAGLLVVGFALAPVVPTTLSIAGRNALGRSATAVSLVTTVGYSAFVLGPPIVGLLADATSLRTALVPVVVSTAAIAVLARVALDPGRGRN
jgi:predicted MFS family arabinose efflux permease